jgi:DNA-binding XRE family transcriptional regulator
MPRRTLQSLYDLMGAERTARVKEMARKKMERILIRDLRKQLGMTQVKVAKRMGISQPALSQLEAQDDMQLSTLTRLAKAMGGEVVVTLRFPQGEVVLRSGMPKSKSRA